MSTLPPPYPLGYVPSLVFSQPPLEKVLREKVASLPNVEVQLGQRLISLTQDDQKATLTFEDAHQVKRHFEAKYVVGCDGASSFVRQAVGIELEDLGFDQPWLVVDVLLNDAGMAKLPKVSMQIREPKRPCTYVIGPQNHRRFEVAINDERIPRKIRAPEKVWSLLSRWMTPNDGVLWRQASYRFHALVAKTSASSTRLDRRGCCTPATTLLGAGDVSRCKGCTQFRLGSWRN
jgi:3-(3-hydroxy-phenyl)propionate hydroxylase